MSSCVPAGSLTSRGRNGRDANSTVVGASVLGNGKSGAADDGDCWIDLFASRDCVVPDWAAVACASDINKTSKKSFFTRLSVLAKHSFARRQQSRCRSGRRGRRESYERYLREERQPTTGSSRVWLQ